MAFTVPGIIPNPGVGPYSSDSQYITTTADYGIKVPGIVEKGNVYGMQFHPEKSGSVGLNLLRTFGNIILKK